MKRTSIALFVASLGLFLLSLANLSPVVSAQLPMPKDDGGGSDPTGAPATPVEVTNALTGTMAVKNFPLRQEVFGTVNVGNFRWGGGEFFDEVGLVVRQAHHERFDKLVTSAPAFDGLRPSGLLRGSPRAETSP